MWKNWVELIVALTITLGTLWFSIDQVGFWWEGGGIIHLGFAVFGFIVATFWMSKIENAWKKV